MSKADEALADVRGWLCDNLSDGNAGMVCGMLSVVSRNINELEVENDKLRERYYAYEYKMDGLVSRLTGGLLSKSAATPNDVLYSSVVEELTEDQIKENCKLEAENAKLREFAREAYDTARGLALNDLLADVSWLADRMRELGIEAE